MNNAKTKTISRFLILTVGLFAAGMARAAVTDLYFRAEGTTNTMPDGRQVAMWGFARDSGPAVDDGVVTVPGPAIVLPSGPVDLVIHLENNLPESTSIVIPGLAAAMGDPQRNVDGRARSFTHEAAPGGTADYTWPSVTAGTYIYHSGSHSAVQVQMGLYGALTKYWGAGEAYSGVVFQSEVTLVYSEIDPDLHDAVATGNYGPAAAMSSTIDYLPRYFLINGQSFTNGLTPISAGAPNTQILLRFLNAGIDYHTPVVDGANLELVAEDGRAMAWRRQSYAVFLPPLKTVDAILNAGQALYPLYDRRLGLVNSTNSPGGMLTYLSVNP